MPFSPEQWRSRTPAAARKRLAGGAEGSAAALLRHFCADPAAARPRLAGGAGGSAAAGGCLRRSLRRGAPRALQVRGTSRHFCDDPAAARPRLAGGAGGFAAGGVAMASAPREWGRALGPRVCQAEGEVCYLNMIGVLRYFHLICYFYWQQHPDLVDAVARESSRVSTSSARVCQQTPLQTLCLLKLPFMFAY